jgi:hypothetical protein
MVCLSFPSHSEPEPPWFPRDPSDESLNIGVTLDLFNRVPLSLKFLFGKERVKLRMTWLAETDGLFHGLAVELPLISLVVVTRARDEVMARQPFFSTAKSTITDHPKQSFWWSEYSCCDVFLAVRTIAIMDDDLATA